MRWPGVARQRHVGTRLGRVRVRIGVRVRVRVRVGVSVRVRVGRLARAAKRIVRARFWGRPKVPSG